AAVGTREGAVGLLREPVRATSPASRDAAALLPHAGEPARGAVLQQRPVPVGRGAGGAVLVETPLAGSNQDSCPTVRALPARSHGRNAPRTGLGLRLHGAGADGRPSPADRGCH